MDSKSPCPKSTGMKIPRTATVLSWQMGPKQPRRPRVAQEAPAGANRERSQQPAAVLVLAVVGEEQAVMTAPVQVVAVQAGLEARSEVVTTTARMMTLTNTGRQGVKVNHQRS